MTDNPQAFPSLVKHFGHNGIQQHFGMTLRDYFAGQALIGILASGSGVTGKKWDGQGEQPYSYKSEDVTHCSYKYADAMLKEKKHNEKEVK